MITYEAVARDRARGFDTLETVLFFFVLDAGAIVSFTSVTVSASVPTFLSAPLSCDSPESTTVMCELRFRSGVARPIARGIQRFKTAPSLT